MERALKAAPARHLRRCQIVLDDAMDENQKMPLRSAEGPEFSRNPNYVPALTVRAGIEEQR